MPKKIFLLIDSLGSGGAQRQLVNLAIGLKRHGHEVSVFIYYPEMHFHENLESEEIPVELIEKKSRFSLAPVFKLVREMYQQKPDLLISYLDTPNFYAEMARLFCPSVKLIVSERFMYVDEKLGLEKYILQQFHRIASHIVVNSNHQRIKMLSKFSWMSKKVSTIYNGYDLNTFSPRESNKDSKSLELIVVSSLQDKKNPINLISAIDICRNRHGVDVKVLWVGKSFDSGVHADCKKRVMLDLKLKKLDNYFVIYGESKNIPSMLANADALIHPSFYEGLPNSVCEALACGKPVIASNVCDHPILVPDGTNGFLFDPNSPEDISQAILKLHQMQQSQRNEMAMNARKFAENNLGIQEFIKKYELKIAEILGGL